MAIKEAIELTGDDTVKQKIEDLKTTAQGLTDEINRLTDSQAGAGFDKFTLNVGGATDAVTSHGKAVTGVTEAYHILNPILREAGLHFGEIRLLAGLAQVGIVGIAAAAIGTAAVAFSTLSQEVEDSRRRLTDFFGSSQLGGTIFDQLSASASKFGTTVKALLPGVEGFVTAWNDFAEKNRTFKFVSIDPKDLPSAENVQKVVQAFTTLKEVLIANNTTVADADKALASFNAELDKTGTVTGQMVKQLLAVAPGALKPLEDALGKTGLSAAALEKQLDQVPVPMDKLVQGLDRIKPAVDAAFDVRPIQSFTENIKNNFGSLEQSLSGLADRINQLKETPLTLAAPGEGIKLPSFDDVISGFETLWAKLKESAAQAGTDVSDAFNTSLEGNPPTFSGILTAFQQMSSQLVSAAQSLWDSIKAILSNPINIPTATTAPGGAPFARGGLVSGPGTGTSDSIMAMLSNREFVVNARSTEFYGPGFFAALNAMLVPRDLLPGFAMGGLVKAIASTPGQSARTPIVLNIDRHTFNMTATDDVAAALQTLSVSEQMSAAGRSPGWRRS